VAATTAPRAARGWRVIAPLWQRPQRYDAPLDGIRALATVAVVLFHSAVFSKVAPLASLPPEGISPVQQWLSCLWTGVDVFFVLSGFLVGRILLEAARTQGRVPFRSFWIRRAFRIFPAYYAILLVDLLVIAPRGGRSMQFLMGGGWETLRDGSWANFLYLSNYFFPGSAPNVMSWGWSLCIEEHFYLLLPFILVPIVRMSSGARRVVIMVAVMMVPVAFRAVQYLRDPTLVFTDGFYYYSHNRFDELWLGVVVAELHVSHADAMKRIAGRAGNLLWIAGLGCFGAVWTFGGLHHTNAFTAIWQFTLAALGSALLIINGLYRADTATRFLAHRAWFPLARVSYGIYLIHPLLIFGLLDHRFATLGNLDFGWSGFAVLFVEVMAAATLWAAVLYTVLERPLLDLGARVARRS
jgi:peptidoglycan/LPS O-acetylase OafA/YrhL